MRAPRTCQGCGKPVRGPCPHCRRAGDRQRGSGTARGWSGKWAAFRAQYLARHPACECGPECCPDGCREPSTDVDHIDGCGRNGARAYDLTNLRALSHSCHAKRTARDQPGGWNAVSR